MDWVSEGEGRRGRPLQIGAQRGGSDLERRSGAVSEPAALAGSEGYEVCSNDVAGMAGLEPAMRESKSLALPLGYTPVSIAKKAQTGAEAPALPPQVWGG